MPHRFFLFKQNVSLTPRLRKDEKFHKIPGGVTGAHQGVSNTSPALPLPNHSILDFDTMTKQSGESFFYAKAAN